MRKLALWLILAFGAWPVAAQEAPSTENLAARLAEVTTQAQYKHAHWGLLIADRQSGEMVFEQNADKLFAPASCTKLYSVACALDCFGADHRFQTPVVRRGEISAGELQGDLILIASGDLSFGGRTNDKGEIEFTNADHTYADGGSDTELTAADPLAGLNDLARQIAESGIKSVRGDVLVDDRLFDKAEGSGSGPGRLTPIMINDNLIDLTIEPAREGERAKVTWRPQTAAIQVECKVETAAKDAKLETSLVDLGNGRLCVRGRIPEGHKRVVRVYEVPDAAAFARSLLIEALARAGVTVDASTLAGNPAGNLPGGDEVSKLPRVALHTSPPLSQSARLVLKVSHNLHASTFPLLVAAKHGDRTLAQGLKRQHDFLERIGVDVETISFGGGAGGSRADYTTPRATVQLLRHMATRLDFAVYHDALPTLGIDGTLSKAVGENSPARGKAFAKTGTLYWHNTMNSRSLLTSKALAGYLTTSHDRELAFAFFVNNVHLRDGVDAKSIGRDLGRLCEIVYEQQ